MQNIQTYLQRYLQNPPVLTGKKPGCCCYLSGNIWISGTNCMHQGLIKFLPGALPEYIISLSKSWICTAILELFHTCQGSMQLHWRCASGVSISGHIAVVYIPLSSIPLNRQGHSYQLLCKTFHPCSYPVGLLTRIAFS